MDLSLDAKNMLDFTKDIGKKMIEELSNYMNKNKMTDDTKVKLQDDIRNIIKNYGEIYEVKDRGVYKYINSSEYPEFNRQLYEGQQNGYYVMNNGNLIYDENLNRKINEKINQRREELIQEQNELLNNYRREGEKYIVDELGDDEKTIYLTRESDGIEFQDFEIKDELYEEIKTNNQKGYKTTLIWNGNEYINI